MPTNPKPDDRHPLPFTPAPPPPRRGCDCCDPTSPSPDPVVVRLEDEVRVLQVGLAELGNRLLTLSTDPPRGYRLANQYGLWWLFDHRGEGVEWGDTLEALVRKLGGAE